MKYKTGELEGERLDCAVSLSLFLWQSGAVISSAEASAAFKPSSNWADGGPIIEKYGINLLGEKSISDPHGFASWSAKIYGSYFSGTPDVLAGATTPLVAAMRAFVRAKLGDEVEL